MKQTIRSQSSSKRLILRGQAFFLSAPKVMGILNVTPDSFSDGGKFIEQGPALEHLIKMKEEGADIVDIGGESTRPGSLPVSESEELDRVLPVLEEAIKHAPDLIYSIDTTKYEVARQTLEAGAHIINDVSGLQKDARLAKLCADYEAGLVLMHSQGEPKTMQQNPTYHNVIEEISEFFNKQLNIARNQGLINNIILDPGFGFGKSLDHNIAIAQHLKRFTTLGYPLLTGASRKSMIGAILHERPAEKRLYGTIALHYDNLLKGAKIIRVHDVQAAVDSVEIFNAIHPAQG